MKRALGIDHGEARVGVALADTLGMFAHPYETIKVDQAKPKMVINRILEIAAHEKVEIIIIGLPRNMNGSYGPAAEKVRAFAETLRARFAPGGGEVRLIDERLTTVAAQKALHASGRNTKNSRPIIDQVAAQMILQMYLDGESLRGGSMAL